MEPFPPLPPAPSPLPGKAIIALFSLQITVALSGNAGYDKVALSELKLRRL